MVAVESSGGKQPTLTTDVSVSSTDSIMSEEDTYKNKQKNKSIDNSVAVSESSRTIHNFSDSNDSEEGALLDDDDGTNAYSASVAASVDSTLDKYHVDNGVEKEENVVVEEREPRPITINRRIRSDSIQSSSASRGGSGGSGRPPTSKTTTTNRTGAAATDLNNNDATTTNTCNRNRPAYPSISNERRIRSDMGLMRRPPTPTTTSMITTTNNNMNVNENENNRPETALTTDTGITGLTDMTGMSGMTNMTDDTMENYTTATGTTTTTTTEDEEEEEDEVERPETAMTLDTEFTEDTSVDGSSSNARPMTADTGTTGDSSTFALEATSTAGITHVGSNTVAEQRRAKNGVKEQSATTTTPPTYTTTMDGLTKKISDKSINTESHVSFSGSSYASYESSSSSDDDDEEEEESRGRITFRKPSDDTSVDSGLSSISGSDSDDDDSDSSDDDDDDDDSDTHLSNRSDIKLSNTDDDKGTNPVVTREAALPTTTAAAATTSASKNSKSKPTKSSKSDKDMHSKESSNAAVAKKSTDNAKVVTATAAAKKKTDTTKSDKKVRIAPSSTSGRPSKTKGKNKSKDTKRPPTRSSSTTTKSLKSKESNNSSSRNNKQNKESTKKKSGMRFFSRKKKTTTTSTTTTSKSSNDKQKRSTDEKVQVFSTGKKKPSVSSDIQQRSEEEKVEKVSILKTGMRDTLKKNKKVSFNDATETESTRGTGSSSNITGVENPKKVKKTVKTKKNGSLNMTLSQGLVKRSNEIYEQSKKQSKAQAQVPVFHKTKDGGRKMKEVNTTRKTKTNVAGKSGFQVHSILLGNRKKQEEGKRSSSVGPSTKVMRVCKLTKYGYVVAEFPSDDVKNTPLHVACLTHYPSQFILDHLTDEDHVKTKNSSGELPLHYAMKDKKGVEDCVMDALLAAYPDAVRHQDIDENLPIHSACMTGVPSFYAMKVLITSCPKSLLVQNDLRVPLDDDEDELSDEEYESNAMCFGINDLMELFGRDKKKKKNYETAWSPLHLASLHGAPPSVIELMLETNQECMSLETNQGRTAIECAKWVVVNALLRNVSIKAYRNTFAAIEIMQSYEREVFKKDVLTVKAGMARAALESVESIGSWWFAAAEMIDNGLDEQEEKRNQDNTFPQPAYMMEDDNDDDDDSDLEYERGLTPLHRAVLLKKGPDEIKRIILDSQECLYMRNIDEKTPIECAKVNIIEAIVDNQTIASMKNTILALEIMEVYNEEAEDEDHGMPVLSRSEMGKMKSKENDPWKVIDRMSFMKSFATNSSLETLLLGPPIVTDNDLAIQPSNYIPPANLKHVNLRINLPVGFRRLRWAMLHCKSKLLSDAVYTSRLKYSQVFVDKWNTHYKQIGLPINNQTNTGKETKRKDLFQDYLGAEKRVEYKVPKSSFYEEHTTYESVEVVDYNDFCFAIKATQRTPDIPEGKLFETHTQIVVVDKGIHNCRMICSSEVQFLGQNKPKDAWRVKNVSRYLTTDFFVALADAICDNAGYSDN